MKIVIDITHISHINIFKHVINKISHHDIFLIGLKRGNIPVVMRNDLKTYKEMSFIGKWKSNKFSIIFNANIFRSLQLFIYLLRINPDVGISSGSIPFSFAMRLIGKPVVDFSDDPERKFVSKLETILCNAKYYPPFVETKNKKVGNYNCLKQWGYLNPDYFTPNIDVLKDYNLLKKQYFFIREVSTASLNYSGQTAGTVSLFAKKLPTNYRVVLSLENKSDRSLYPSDWIILQEPVKDIHSLIYYSKILISSGDSMAREGAILGVPSIYCGNRTMGANTVMIDEGVLFKTDPKDVPKKVVTILKEDISITTQEKFRNNLNMKWDDLNKFIVEKVNKYLK